MYKVIEKDIDLILSKVDMSPLKDKKVLVTGASGLLGLYFVSCLKRIQSECNVDVYLWVKNDIGDDFKYFFDFPCTIIQNDITDFLVFKGLPKFDFVIHSSGYGQPGKFMNNKIKTIEINTTSTIELLKKTVESFLFVSTSELYNGLEKFGITEDDIGMTNTNHPRSCYIEGKRCGEAICNSVENVNIKIARLSLGYGPGTKKGDHRVMNSIIEKGLKNDNIKLLDGGESIRTYCYISDVIEMMWNILLYGKQTVYNVGGKSSVSILELAEKIGSSLNKDVIVPENKKSLAGSPKIVNISIQRYVDEFNKEDFVNLTEGLNNTIEWQKNMYGIDED